jgi:HlyD family secretion protein/adhesin transport system membrane fusion protein
MIKLKLVKIEALDEPDLKLEDARDTCILAKEAPRALPEERGPDYNDYAVPKSVPKPELKLESKKLKRLPQLVKIEAVDEPDLKVADPRDTGILAKELPCPIPEERGTDCNDYAAPKPAPKPELKPESKKPKLLPPRLRNPKQKEVPPPLETPKQAEQVTPTAPTVPPQPKPVPSPVPKPAGGSGLIRWKMIAILMVICAFFGWAQITNVDEFAVTSGKLVPTGQVQAIQHLEGGIISEILIDEGEVVKAEQVLIRLDPANAQTELNQMKFRQAALTLKAERFRAVETEREPDFTIFGDEYKNLVNDQYTVYQSQIEASEKRSEVVVAEIELKKQELTLFDEREETASKRADLLLEELVLRESLYKEGLTTKTVYLGIKRQVNDARVELSNMIVERRRISESLEESQDNLRELDTNEKEQALTQMGVVTNELAQVNSLLDKLYDRVRRLKILSPIDGVIKGLKVHTAGGVISAGAIILEIMPLNEELLVETRITTRDVGHVEIGQPATIKVTAYDYARYGSISGELKEISSSTFLDKQGDLYYKGVISMDRDYVGNDPQVNKVFPGMTVQADIKTGRKTLLEYLLKPIVSSIGNGFRER